MNTTHELVNLRQPIVVAVGDQMLHVSSLVGELKTWCPHAVGGRGKELDPYEMRVTAVIVPAGGRLELGKPIRVDLSPSAIASRQPL